MTSTSDYTPAWRSTRKDVVKETAVPLSDLRVSLLMLERQFFHSVLMGCEGQWISLRADWVACNEFNSAVDS
jgi:hypothetical protein